MTLKFFLLFLMMYLKQMWLSSWNYLFGDWYHKTFDGCIYMVEVFHMKTASKSILERQTLADICLQRKRTKFLVHPIETQCIFKITCTDGATHLTKNSYFSMKKLKNKNKVLNAVIVQGDHSVDITDFVNAYYASFNETEKFSVDEIFKIAYTEKVIQSLDYHRFCASPTAVSIEVIYDDVFLTTKIFKEIIVL
jgi:hypothetical protein